MGNLSEVKSGGNLLVSGGAGTTTPPLLDLTEFPTLSARRAGDNAPASRAGDLTQVSGQPSTPGTKPYVGMVKQPTDQLEFKMTSEDFPALPGTSSTPKQDASPARQLQRNGTSPVTWLHKPDDADGGEDKPRNGIQVSRDGNVTNIPPSMIPNQFGIAGLLTFICSRTPETDPDLVSLALGQDMRMQGLNLKSRDNLYLTFAGPWSDKPCRPQDMEYQVPPEYLVQGALKRRLPPLCLSKRDEDLLFYLFYCFVGDALQIAAAIELFNRQWRYHMEEKVWISKVPGMPIIEKTPTYESGFYYIFDPHNWRKVTKEFCVYYNKLEGRPQLPPPLLT